MIIAIDVSPLNNGHKVRGVGFYLEHLKKSLLTYYSEHTYVFFSNRKEIQENIDLIHYPYFEPFFITLPFFEKSKRIITVHDLTPLVFPKHFPAGIKGNLSWKMQKVNLKMSDAIITDSFSSQKDITKFTGIKKEKIYVGYLAADEEFRQLSDRENKINTLKKKYHLPEKFVLSVGDVTWNKNLPRLLKAIEQSAIPLVMVGKTLVEKNYDKTNPWNKDLVEVQKLIQTNKKIITLGFIPTEDLITLYNAATVFIMPSLYEGFGLPVLEAMQSGCPVITTKEGSLPEIAGDAAVYVDAYDSENIAKGIHEVFENKKLQETLIKKGFDQAKKFTWKKTAEQTIAAYKGVLS